MATEDKTWGVPQFDGEVILVTGAAQGLGYAIADDLEKAGATVVRADIQGGDIVVDISTKAGNAEMVDYALRTHGRIDGLVLNAGVHHISPIENFPEEQWDRLLGVMLKGPFLALQAAWEELKKSPLGRVVAISSVSGEVAELDRSAYTSAKTGVLGLVRAAAIEGSSVGVSVNAVLPGWMRTAMSERQVDAAIAAGASQEEALSNILTRQPVKRFVETTEVAATVRFLLSSEASGINGVSLPVDLGLLAQ